MPPKVDDQDETCPVCKTTRYLNADLKFLINPECYHRMCATCVSRIFKDGPAQCPYATCPKTLRLRGFRTAFFADLSVEREVDIRRRVAAIFNKVQDDFETLDGFNDYLYMVECLTDDLVNGDNMAREAAQQRLAEWEAKHKAEIERNKRLARESETTRQSRLAADQETARARRLQDARDTADAKLNAARFKEEVLDTLQSAESGKAKEVLGKVILKKRGQAQTRTVLPINDLSIRGLRSKPTPQHAADMGPYDPFGGLDMTPVRVDISGERLGLYKTDLTDRWRTKDEWRVGGYSVDTYLSRTLFEMVSGLGVFVGEDENMEVDSF